MIVSMGEPSIHSTIINHHINFSIIAQSACPEPSNELALHFNLFDNGVYHHITHLCMSVPSTTPPTTASSGSMEATNSIITLSIYEPSFVIYDYYHCTFIILSCTFYVSPFLLPLPSVQLPTSTLHHIWNVSVPYIHYESVQLCCHHQQGNDSNNIITCSSFMIQLIYRYVLRVTFCFVFLLRISVISVSNMSCMVGINRLSTYYIMLRPAVQALASTSSRAFGSVAAAPKRRVFVLGGVSTPFIGKNHVVCFPLSILIVCSYALIYGGRVHVNRISLTRSMLILVRRKTLHWNTT
jgi:hypothetical protein